MDIYKYQIWTGYIPGSKPIDPCKKGAVNPNNTEQDCNCPPFIMGTLPNGNYGMLETNFTGLLDPDRLSGVTYDTSDPNNVVAIVSPPVSPLGGYQLGDVVLADHDVITPYNPRAGCLNEQGPHCFVYFQEDYNITGFDYFTSPEGPAPWKSPVYPLDSPYYEPGIGIVGTASTYAGTGSGGGSYQGGPWMCCDSTDIVDITAHNGPDHQLTVFLDQDFNDIGFYTPFDGGIFQKDLFSNFITVVESGTTDTISLTNSTPFGLYGFTQGFSFTVDWGDGSSQQVQYPTIELTHQYTQTGNYIIGVQMVAPWGITSMSQPITIPYYSGSSLVVSNPNLSFTYNSPSGNSVTQNWMYSSFGPLDSGTNVSQYVTANYAPVPLTVTGITDSQLINFSTYSTQPSNSAFLPNGYFLNQPVPLGGEIQVGIGDFQTTLFGEIISASANFTAYTISDGGSLNNPVQMYDYSNGITIFEVDTVGLNQYNLFTQSCDPLSLEDLDEDPEVCDFCLTAQTAFFQSSSYQINVTNNRGLWDPGSSYQPGDLVRWAGCCWFAGVTVPPPLAIPPNDPIVFEGGSSGTPIGWWPCPGQNCEATTAYDPADIFGCMDSSALNYDSLATIDDGSCVFDNITIPDNWDADDPVDGDEVGFTGSTTDTGSTSVSTSFECCDSAAINYAGSPPCGNSGVVNDTSLCNYPGGGDGDIWVCDPNNDLNLRCVSGIWNGNPTNAIPNSGPDQYGCSAVEYPATFQYTSPFGGTLPSPDTGQNCSNAVPTPDSTEIDAVQNGGFIGIFNFPAADPTDTWGIGSGYPNTAGGRGTGCVKINLAWHAPLNTQLTLDPAGTTNINSTSSQGVTAYGCSQPTNCFSWEWATLKAGQNLAMNLTTNGTLPYTQIGVIPGFNIVNSNWGYAPGLVPRDMTGTAVAQADNKINPVVELVQVYTNFGLTGTFPSFPVCMEQNAGCPSTVINLNY